MKNLFKTKMNFDDYDKLNPESILAFKEGVGMFILLLDDPYWLHVGHIPKPTTRIGWFTYHMIHGLSMRYPPLAVINYAFRHTKMDDQVCEAEEVADD